MPNIPFEPTWKKHEAGMHSDDAKVSIREAEAFSSERKKEIAFSKRARDWEEDRKKQIAKDKPHWKKEQLKKEKEAAIAPMKKLLDAGVFECNLVPTPGHIIIEIDSNETKTESGIFIATETEEEPNTGKVLVVGGKVHCKHCFADSKYRNVSEIEPTPPPVSVGDRVLFKKMAGIEIDIKGKKARLMMFSDILARFEQ